MPPTKKEQILHRLRSKLDDTPDHSSPFDAIADNPLGAEVLQRIYKELGKDGIEAFAKPALHPMSEFMFRPAEMKTLADDVRKIIDDTVRDANDRIDQEFQRIHGGKPMTITRREALIYGAAMGAEIGAISGIIADKYFLSDSDRLNMMARGAIIGAVYGGVQGVRSFDDIGAEEIKRLKPAAVHITPDKAMKAAVDALDAYVTPAALRQHNLS